jgi:nicotinate-nucleotide adenylyltransferase
MDSGKGKGIGLLGGTFDPVHCGHLAAAKAVSEALHLDTVIFIPAYQPPHKHHLSLSPFMHRLAMLELALRPWPGFQISRMEAERNGPSFTCDTLAELREDTAADTRLFFITGIDAFKEIHTWKKYKQLLQFADLAVIARPPHDEKSLDSYIQDHFKDHFYDQSQKAWISRRESGAIHLVCISPVAISSTEIRKKIELGEGVEGLVPDAVAEYIRKKGLYKSK